MTPAHTRVRKAIKPLVGSIAALLLCGNARVLAAGGTWILNPSGDWGAGANWTSGDAPNSSSDTAFFGVSNGKTVSLSTSTTVNEIVFGPGASAFRIDIGGNSLAFEGNGITNLSGKTQNFVVGGESGSSMDFFISSTAGSNTIITVLGGADSGDGKLHFWDSSTAGQATLIATGGPGSGGGIYFENDSTGGKAAVQVYGNGFLDVSNHNAGNVTIGSLAGNGLVFLGANNLTIGSNSQSTVFSGTIQDGGEGGGTGGSLTKIGTGTLALNGANTYTGNTIVNGGTLFVNGSIVSPFTIVNAGGTLGGYGFIGGSVSNYGVVSPGDAPGTFTIKGNYEQSSMGKLVIQIASPTVFGQLIVGGAASLDGTLFVEPLNDPGLKKGEKFEVLAAGGGVSGFFDHFEQSSTGTILKFKVIYQPDDVLLKTVVAPFSDLPGLTPNQTSVARALDRIVNDHRASGLIDFLSTVPLGDLPNDFDKIAAEGYTSIFTLGESFDNVQSLNLQNRTDSIRSGSSGFSAAGLSINGINPGFNGSIAFRSGTAGPTGDDGKESKEMKQVAPADNRWGAFLTGTGEWVSVGDDYNARGYDIATGGFTLGVDYKVCPHFAVGLMAGYIGTSVDLNDNGRVLVNGGKLGLYATAFGDGFYTDAAVTGGYSSYDMHRSALQGTARGDTDGGDLNALFGAGYDFKSGGFTFGPTATFNYTYVGIGDFTESGSLAPLHFPSQGQESVRTAFGFKASYDWKVGGMMIKPEIRTAWQHEYGDAAYEIDSSFANGAGNNFTVNGPRLGRDSLLLGAGFAIQMTDRCSTYFYYDGDLGGTRYNAQNVSGGLRVSF